MKKFTYIIKDEAGIHARPAGMLVNEAGKYASTITLSCDDKRADAARLMALMAMGVKCGQEVTVTVEGQDEETAAQGIKKFMEENL